MAKTFYNASLAFLCNYTDGTKKDEIEYDLYRVIMQVKGLTHYDREMGASFEDLEQQNYDDPVVALLFAANVIKSVYKLNEKRNFNPFIVVGYTDLKIERGEGSLYVTVQYRLLQDILKVNEVTIEL